MNSRRDFLKKAALVAGSGLVGIPASIQKALAIDPAPGSTWLDAEHVVILMQENRSFDHCFGSLRGVRGFNDPHAATLPNGLPVWVQGNRGGESYAPFRLDIHDTKATWMSSLPHSWVDQTDARNGGRMDGWLDAKRSGNRQFSGMPLTMGFYDRRDLPFYYALADAFTVCDQNFCSSLTGTTPNRLHLWTGTLRDRPEPSAKANVRNEDVDYGSEASWTTFPERLEAAGVSWRVYQNEISLDSGLRGEQDAWLSNFTDNPLEWFRRYHVRFAPSHRRHLEAREAALPGEIAALEAQPEGTARDRRLASARAELESVRKERATYTDAAFAALPEAERRLHEKAFTINSGDTDFRKLTSLSYKDGEVERRMQVPKGDTLHRFREDVARGTLPTVSWIVAPENFSDHPGAPWYGAWYLSECLDILTRNPEVWRKTIFVLCYDENDGYFDHVPPFVPPDPTTPGSGKVSEGIDPRLEWVFMAQEDERQKTRPGSEKRSGPVGLGFRVPLVIASPWTRGGYVNSEVCDHTSIVRMLETLLSHRTGKRIREDNITAWRRTVCGDLTSVFRPWDGQGFPLPKAVEREPFLGSIHQAQFRQLPSGFRRLGPEDLALARTRPREAAFLPRQEPGTRPACALPYELSVDASEAPGQGLEVRFTAGRKRFGTRSAGAPFRVVQRSPSSRPDGSGPAEVGRTRDYAVAAGDTLVDTWTWKEVPGGRLNLRVNGPNGFLREFSLGTGEPVLGIRWEESPGEAHRESGILGISNPHESERVLRWTDRGYGRPAREIRIPGKGHVELALDLKDSRGWYDFALEIPGVEGWLWRYAGHVETGMESVGDPRMGAGPA